MAKEPIFDTYLENALRAESDPEFKREWEASLEAAADYPEPWDIL